MNPVVGSPAVHDHIIVIGSSSTAIRLVEELERAGEHVLVLVVDDEPVGASAYPMHEMAESGAQILQVTGVRVPELRRVYAESARAAVVLGFDDVITTRIALLLEELNPGLRLVLELSNPTFANRLSTLLGECTVLSSTQLAAPAFATAALTGSELRTFELAGRTVTAGSRDRVGGTTLAVLGDTRTAGIAGVLTEQGDLILGTEALPEPHRQARQSGLWGAVVGLFDRRLRWVITGLLVLMVGSVVYFRVAGQVTWLEALYLALTAATLTGIGDTAEELSLGTRFGGVVIQMVGLVLSSGITAVIVDALIKSRIGELTGGVRGRPRHHVILCGLGRIGTEVLRDLHRRGVPVVAIERNRRARGVLRARQLKVPVLIAESTDPAVLAQAGVASADALLALTDDDAANLEIGLVAQVHRPDLRIVTRMFDHDLAGRVENRLRLGATRSVSMVAAPAFAAAALGRRTEVIYSVGRRVVIFTELQIRAGSIAEDGVLPTQLDSPGNVRLLAVQRRGASWDWQPGPRPLLAGDKVAVAATRSGLASLLQQIKPGGDHSDDA